MLSVAKISTFCKPSGMKNRIDEIRKQRKLTLEKLAEKCGTSLNQIYKLIRGERRLTLDWLNRIAKALNCSVADLISDTALIDKKDGEIDPVRLKKAQDAIEKIIREKSLKLTRQQVTELLTQVYNETLKLEERGENISPQSVANLLTKK